MRNVNLAERILGLFTDRERAATIAGDLAETAQTRGGLWFWRSVGSAAIGMGWRSPATFVACMAMQFVVAAAMARIMNAISVAGHGRALAPIGPILGFSAMLLSGVALYAAFRYGIRDWLTRLAGGIALVAFVGGAMQQSGFAPKAAIAAVMGLTVVAAMSQEGRRALLATVAAFSASAAVFVGGPAEQQAQGYGVFSVQLRDDHCGAVVGLLEGAPKRAGIVAGTAGKAPALHPPLCGVTLRAE